MMNASIPCTKSRWSYSSSAVAFVGAPSRNSSVPRRLSTRSGVEIDRNVSAETPSCPLPLIASSVIVVCVTELGGAAGARGNRALGHIHRHRPGDQGAVPGPGGDLDRGAAGRELDDDRVVAEPLHAVGVRRMLPASRLTSITSSRNIERRLGPHQNVADPAARTPLPLQAQALDRSVRHPDPLGELAGLPFAPSPAPEHRTPRTSPPRRDRRPAR